LSTKLVALPWAYIAAKSDLASRGAVQLPPLHGRFPCFEQSIMRLF
jgi:hypothetical protein